MTTGAWSRRRVLAMSLQATLMASAAPALARTIRGEMPWTPGQVDAPSPFDGARFLTPDERRCVGAIVERLIPSDARGPGAREAGVIDFIDNQLAGFYGRGERWYMQGPFGPSTPEQGYQFEEPPAGFYRRGVAALDAACRERHGGRVFAALDAATQDSALGGMEKGGFDLPGGIPAKAFFTLVRENAIEGFFCDPFYGGNRDMVGWRLVGFPGARYDYRPYLNHNGQRITLEPVGLKGGPTWNPR
ncbi:MAG: gluconate 2-dehydrogenase subunit 3 family protein [Phreatobacter sp.]|uniref:gluconate 2-dehydrogenase subunit 3 family protein n=1 Tax=Phreatobacter sp. TaxID=1966341 RepID=UPI00403657E6